jgi:hypothetical protein
MEIIALLSGTIFKITDEILDTNYTPLVPYAEYSKTLCTIILSIFLYKDVFVSVIFIIALLPVCFYRNQIDNTYFKSLIPLPFITILLQYNTIQYNGVEDTLIKIFIGIIVFCIAFIEDVLFPEETSTRKIVSRFMLVGMCIGILYVIHNFIPSLDYAVPFVYFTLGYYFTSILFKTVFLHEHGIQNT